MICFRPGPSFEKNQELPLQFLKPGMGSRPPACLKERAFFVEIFRDTRVFPIHSGEKSAEKLLWFAFPDRFTFALIMLNSVITIK